MYNELFVAPKQKDLEKLKKPEEVIENNQEHATKQKKKK